MGKLTASELRIGNWVYITDISTHLFYKEETQINIHNMMYLCGESKEPIDYEIEPIPLNEEWLLKFGFEKKLGNYELENFRFNINKPINFDGFLFCEGYSVITDKIQYVHQLQNLYFALTNEELTIK